jgi:hypothetical protein
MNLFFQGQREYIIIIIVNSQYSFFKAITANDALAPLTMAIWLSHEIF